MDSRQEEDQVPNLFVSNLAEEVDDELLRFVFTAHSTAPNAGCSETALQSQGASASSATGAPRRHFVLTRT